MLLLRTLIVGIIFASLTSGLALASPDTHADSGFKRCERKHDEWLKQRNEALATLHNKIALKPEQEAAWSEWSAAFTAKPKDWEQRSQDKSQWEGLPVLEKLQKKLERTQQKEARIQAEIVATQHLLKELTEEQKALFNQNFNVLKTHHGEEKERGH
jgi:hypothetical protein